MSEAEAFDRGGYTIPHRTECTLCQGTGEIDPIAYQRRQAGESMRLDRIARRVSLREEAQRLGLTPQELNRRERGLT